MWGVTHKFSIAIVEHAHGLIKCVLEKQKGGMLGETPQNRLAKALYTINHLTVPPNSNNPVLLNHFFSLQSAGDAPAPSESMGTRFTH